MTPMTRSTLLVSLLAITVLCCGCGDDDPSAPVATGTIAIDVTPDDIGATWTLSGAGGFSLDGTGDRTVANLDVGDYTLVWGDANGYVAPPDETVTLAADSTLTLAGSYTPIGVTATLVTQIGSYGSDELQFNSVGDIDLDPSGNLYVCDKGNYRVQKIGPDGSFILQIDHDRPWDIETDEDGDVYVWGDWRLVRYDGDGDQQSGFNVLTYGTADGSNNRFAVSRTTDELVSMNVYSGNVSVYDADVGSVVDKPITEFQLLRTRKSDNAYIDVLGSEGTGDGQFRQPYAADFDAAGRLYVMDTRRGNVQVFQDGTYVGEAPTAGGTGMETGFCIDDDDRLYYRNGNTVRVVSSDGSNTGSFDVVDPDVYVGTKYIQTRNEPDTGDVLLYAANGHSVAVYRLTFVGW